jgi:hypothetical protein
MPHGYLARCIIDGLPAEFNPGKHSLYGPCAAAGPESILYIIKQHASGIGFNDLRPRPVPKAAKTTIPDSEKTEGSGRGRGRPRCWECGKIGHISKDCELKKKDKPAETEQACKLPNTHVKCKEPMVTHNVFSNARTSSCSEDWLIDSGASVHLVNDISLLQNMTVYDEPRALQLATTGANGGIVAAGSVCLLNSEGKPAWIHNVQCVPDASTNLLSVSAGIRDGLTFAVNDSGAYVRVEGQDGWSSRVQEMHGLYNMRGVYPTLTPVVCQTCMRTVPVDHLSPKLKHDCKLRQVVA